MSDANGMRGIFCYFFFEIFFFVNLVGLEIFVREKQYKNWLKKFENLTEKNSKKFDFKIQFFFKLFNGNLIKFDKIN